MNSPFHYPGAVALVTGASSGIGEAFARALAARGVAGLILVARSAEKLEAIAEELRDRYNVPVEVIPADLSDPDAPARIHAEVVRRKLRVDLLVSNAGFGTYGPFVEREWEREVEMVAVNAAAVVALAHRFLPDMLARRRGGILHVASTAAFQPVPYMATYGATKAFVLSFSEALWAETRGTGVRVACVCPGGTRTHFADDLERRGRFESLPQSTPEEVAEGGLAALDRDACTVVVGTANYVGTLGARLMPRAAVARVTGALFRPVRPGKRAPARAATLAAFAGALLVGYTTLRVRRRDD